MTLTVNELRKKLDYNSETGVFTWKIKKRGTDIGKEAGHVNKIGYREIRIDGKLYYAHRLAWFYHYGKWPKEQLDHIDKNETNNSISNLREATNRQNSANKKMYKANKSGYRGVCWYKAGEKWHAQITVNGNRIHLGYYNDPKEAHKVYKKAAKKHFGEFFTEN